MKLSIIGCPDKERFRPYVKRAVSFYAEQLISKKMLENINLRIKFDGSLDVYGYASVEEFNGSGKPREFCIEIHPGIGAADILETLAHEMVHIKQYTYSETNANLTRWRGQKIGGDVDYYNHPWEIEAYGMSVGLYTKFVVREQLWNVFKRISNPDSEIEIEELGWKEHA